MYGGGWRSVVRYMVMVVDSSANKDAIILVCPDVFETARKLEHDAYTLTSQDIRLVGMKTVRL